MGPTTCFQLVGLVEGNVCAWRDPACAHVLPWLPVRRARSLISAPGCCRPVQAARHTHKLVRYTTAPYTYGGIL